MRIPGKGMGHDSWTQKVCLEQKTTPIVNLLVTVTLHVSSKIHNTLKDMEGLPHFFSGRN